MKSRRRVWVSFTFAAFPNLPRGGRQISPGHRPGETRRSQNGTLTNRSPEGRNNRRTHVLSESRERPIDRDTRLRLTGVVALQGLHLGCLTWRSPGDARADRRGPSGRRKTGRQQGGATPVRFDFPVSSPVPSGNGFSAVVLPLEPVGRGRSRGRADRGNTGAIRPG